MSITIVGLGPGNPGLITTEVWEILNNAEEIYVRTIRHPTVSALPEGLKVHSFDHLYEEKETFDEVYQAIAEEVIKLGSRPQGVIYAVPGHPLVGEATTKLILELAAKAGVEVSIKEGLSFLEPVFTTLRLDPVDGLQIVDASELAAHHHPRLDPDRPAIVAQLYDRFLASQVKAVLLDIYPEEHPLTLVIGAGTAQEEVVSLPLYELDRYQCIDHLTSLYIPPLPEESSPISLQEVVAHLRSPEGCPWDRQQTHRSLRPYLLEETYEVLEALDSGDTDKLRDELGDLLLQVVLHAQIALEEGEFKLEDVIAGLIKKLKRRHPHVFGGLKVKDAEEVLHNWEEIKRSERGEKDFRSLLNGVPKSLPALAQAQAYQRKVARVGFDWPDVEGVWEKVQEELEELKQARTQEEREAEVGDVLFAMVNLARWLKVDAESALREANARFTSRFREMERLASERGHHLSELNLDQQDRLWEESKKHDKRQELGRR
ncbi:MAG TPA: nucleoside triphosphate pyrophosphohydrolase [Chloroflexi bacterium]|nr:nucleoside triphosphate pyrophosphohydrolase [Chloroflexota bacterium]